VIDVAMLRRTVYGRRIMGLENEENFGDEEPRKAKSKRDHVRGKKPKTSTETDPRRATRGAKDSSPGRHRSSGKKASPKTSQPLKKKKNSAKGVSAKGVSAKGVSAKGKKKTSTKKAKARK
jgi:hypothetical protein